MSDFEYLLVKMFIEENWKKFLKHCAEHGLTEDDAEAILKKLEDET